MSESRILSNLHPTSPIRRPRRLNNNEDINYSTYLEKLSREHAHQETQSPPVRELKRKQDSESSDGEDKKSKD